MDKEFWLYFHSIMFSVLLVIWVFTQIVRDGKDISKNLKQSKSKSEYSIGETIVLIIILFAAVLALIVSVQKAFLNKSMIAIWIAVIYLVVLAYIAIEQITKMIFLPARRAFSVSDIQGFVFTYMFWWIIIVAMYSLQSKVDMLSKIKTNARDAINVVLMLLCYYFNILFALGGIYILLYYFSKIKNKIDYKLSFIKGKVRDYIDVICSSCKNGESFSGLRSFKLWQQNKKGIVYKLLMTIPLFIFDILNVLFIFIKMLIKTMFVESIIAILGPIKALSKLIKKLWNQYENNEWMYVFAQVAGLCSYVIVFLIIQYSGEGQYGEEIKSVYEFVGTVILIPYLLSKIMNVQKVKENVSEVTVK